ncbi:dermonecrotic toxin domain-containing protein [Pseudomonas aegrilactucae]|uniref:dermonecrotic toxin domain-containing protein n=1 Tax=Pseudomonas aegrilactucae TaxID=2854028 RepID=UPI0031345735
MPAIAPLPHAQFIRERLPGWLRHTTAQNAQDLRQHLALTHTRAAGEPDWLANGRPEHRQAVQAARSAYRRSSQVLARTLGEFKGILAFAEPLLQARLHAEPGHALDVHTTDLVQFHEESIPWLLASRTRYQKQSLLQAALQNFGDDVTFHPSSAITLAGNFQLDLNDKGELSYRYLRHPLQPAVYARLCRELDLGGQYQLHLQRVFETPATRDKVRRDSIDTYRDALRLEIALGRARRGIGEAARTSLLALLDGVVGGSTVEPAPQAHLLSMHGVALHDILLLGVTPPGQPDTWLLYLPGDLDEALSEHASMHALERYLKGRLSVPGFRDGFRRYVPLEQQQHLFAVLKHNLAPLALYDDGPWHPDEQASLSLRSSAVRGELFGALQERHIQRLKEDARTLAVPTAEADEQVRKARLAYWENAALNGLNAAAMFVPALGPVMLVVTAVQLVNEVYDGIEDWRDGDVEGAMAHLQSVAITAGMMVGATVAISAAPALLDALVEVQLPDGRPRLHLPDLAAYRPRVPPPDGLVANARGQYQHLDTHYVKLGTELYEQGFDAHLQQWRVRHPSRPDAYQPVLEHNGQGAWHSVHEQPLTWPRATLLRRLGARVEDLTDTELEQACQVSATDDDTLRRVHVANLPLPPLLADTLQRLKIDRLLRDSPISGAARRARFEHHYQALGGHGPAAERLDRALRAAQPGLGRGAARQRRGGATGTLDATGSPPAQAAGRGRCAVCRCAAGACP